LDTDDASVIDPDSNRDGESRDSSYYRSPGADSHGWDVVIELSDDGGTRF